MARAWFLRVLLNSSSFSETFLSISCLTCANSSCPLSTLFSSASRPPAALLSQLQDDACFCQDHGLIVLHH